jgi:plastocyanin
MRRMLAGLAMLALGLGGACGGGDGDGGGAAATTTPVPKATVNVKGFTFDPNPLTVKAGTQVTWVNDDDVVHSVSSGTRGQNPQLFDGALQAEDDEFTYTFAQVGSFDYNCKVHDGMDGRVVVTQA